MVDPTRHDDRVLRLLPWLVAVAFFMESLDTTILNTAVPTISSALGITPLNMKSVLSSYTLSLAVFIPVSGWLADRFGTRRVFATAIAVFSLGSLLCGISSDVRELVAARILQGAGGAMMVPVGRLTLVRSFDKSQLVRVMSFVAIPALVGPLLGPLAGGLIVRYLHWRVIFFVNLPIGLVGILFVHLYLPDYRGVRVPRLDFVGMVLFGGGLALLSYVLEVFGEHTLGALEIVALLALSFALLYAYARHAAITPSPLLRTSLFSARTFRVAIVGSFVTRIGAGGMPFLLPMLYQIGLGYSPVASGLLIMPQSLAAMALKAVVPGILTRLGYRAVLLANTLLVGTCIALASMIGPGTPLPLIVAFSTGFGFFMSLQYTAMNTLVYADVPPEEAAMASTIMSTAQQLSMSFGVAGASLLAALFVPESLRKSPSQLMHGLHLAFRDPRRAHGAVCVRVSHLAPRRRDSVSKHPEAAAHAE